MPKELNAARLLNEGLSPNVEAVTDLLAFYTATGFVTFANRELQIYKQVLNVFAALHS